MTQTFACPSCGAPLDYCNGDAPSIRCLYCGTSVIVPKELRDDEPAPIAPDQLTRLRELGRLVRAGRKIEAIKLYRALFQVGLKEAKEAVEQLSAGKSVQMANMTIETSHVFGHSPPAIPIKALVKQAQPALRLSGCIGTIITLSILGLVFLLIAGGIFFITNTNNDDISSEAPSAKPTSLFQLLEPLVASTPIPTATPSFAHVALVFGKEGTGPGRFTDARSIAVDGEGNIYVGEYSDGRIQVFDAAGQFISLWMVDDAPLRGLAADRQGTIYVVQGGIISRYQGATGQLLGQVKYAAGWGFDDVAVTADGGLAAAWYKSHDDLVRFDAGGQLLWITESAISSQTGRSELNTRVAVDGLGAIYALGSFNDAVFKFSPEGQYVNKFGGRGGEPGQFRGLQAIAVDGQGRVYVSDIQGIQVFDADGRYLELVDVDGPAFGMVFNDQNELLVAARTQVFKYVLD